ncbi:MAG TPA: hypothetical protein VKY73_15070 [Polyangiaceae bacterium]|nr:hypothetical protein [Polyangiaceae bacterium]
MSRVRHLRWPLSLIALLFCAAPVPGDVGGCGGSPRPLEAAAFFETKAALDCTRCTECRIASKTCTAACSESPDESFPRGCDPLEHDGIVCVRALEAASCEDYRSYVRDEAPVIPTECNFCPETAP